MIESVTTPTNMSYLKRQIDELDRLIRQLPDKFSLFYNGKPRKAFTQDALLTQDALGTRAVIKFMHKGDLIC